MSDMKKMPEEYWRKKLSPREFNVLREKATETPFTGKLLNNKDKGVYVCMACGVELFSSDTKYESGTGWPSFWNAMGNKNIEISQDGSFGMNRIEVKCANCGSHLGHLFDDGPAILPDGKKATGKRYCINSCSLDFKKQ